MALDKKVTKKIKKIISKKDDDKYNEFKTEEERKYMKLKPGDKLYDSEGNEVFQKEFKAKGGMVKGYMDGGEVEVAMDNSPSSGMITQRGWGASRKT
jgi:hypothetical protein